LETATQYDSCLKKKSGTFPKNTKKRREGFVCKPEKKIPTTQGMSPKLDFEVALILQAFIFECEHVPGCAAVNTDTRSSAFRSAWMLACVVLECVRTVLVGPGSKQVYVPGDRYPFSLEEHKANGWLQPSRRDPETERHRRNFIVSNP
jgi:hypothetical protein